MNTLFLLIAEFETGDIKLEDCCDKYFGMNYAEARRKATMQQLPVPVYRGGSQKSPWLISAQDLAKYLDDKRERARSDWRRMNNHAA